MSTNHNDTFYIQSGVTWPVTCITTSSSIRPYGYKESYLTPDVCPDCVNELLAAADHNECGDCDGCDDFVYPVPTHVVFSGKQTHVFFEDGTKVSVSRKDDDPEDREHAVASAIAHRVFGSKTQFRKFVAQAKVQLTKEEKKAKKASKLADDEFPF